MKLAEDVSTNVADEGKTDPGIVAVFQEDAGL
jgi:hypothetical protein